MAQSLQLTISLILRRKCNSAYHTLIPIGNIEENVKRRDYKVTNGRFFSNYCNVKDRQQLVRRYLRHCSFLCTYSLYIHTLYIK